MIKKTRILFISTHNAIRSQIAEGYLRFRYGDRFESYSAGTEPLPIHPMTIEVMNELGIDISGQQSKEIFIFLDKNIDIAVLLSDKASYACPTFPGATNTIHQEFFNLSYHEERKSSFKKEILLLRGEIITWIDENITAGGLFYHI